MSTPAYFRTEAARCRAMAASMPDSSAVKRWLQLALEYDPQPPFDSGHMSKASATTKAAATALLSRDSAKPANLKATTMIAWEQALSAVRSRRRRRQPNLSSA